jgi:adenylate cyclase class IV
MNAGRATDGSWQGPGGKRLSGRRACLAIRSSSSIHGHCFALYLSVPAKRSSEREIEIKLSVDDLADLLRRLRRLGAVSRGRVHEQNTLFDTPDSGFRRSGRLLRLRQQTPAPSNNVAGGTASSILTAKAPLLSGPQSSAVTKKHLYKEVQENEESVSDPRRLSQALKRLDFRTGFRYEKYRTTFRLNALLIDQIGRAHV